jgi:hypothetical protein
MRRVSRGSRWTSASARRTRWRSSRDATRWSWSRRPYPTSWCRSCARSRAGRRRWGSDRGRTGRAARSAPASSSARRGSPTTCRRRVAGRGTRRSDSACSIRGSRSAPIRPIRRRPSSPSPTTRRRTVP